MSINDISPDCIIQGIIFLLLYSKYKTLIFILRSMYFLLNNIIVKTI